MSEMHLDAALREQKGKGVARKLRRRGIVPAIVYGLHEPVKIQVDAATAFKLVQQLHGSERMISLRLADGKGKKGEDKHVLVKEVQANPVTGHLLHLDFQEVEISQEVQVAVDVHPVGTAEGVRLGGVMQVVKHDVQIACLPMQIPESIEVDVSALPVGGSLHVKDLELPEGIRLITDPDETLIVISAPRSEEELEAEEAEEEAAEGEVPAEEAAAEEESEDAGQGSDQD